MAQDRVQVQYSKKVSLEVQGGKFETVSIGGSVEFDIAEGVEWQDAYEGAYVTYRLIIDKLIDESQPRPAPRTEPVPWPSSDDLKPRALPGESIAPKPAVAVPTGIVANAPVAFTDCKVFKVEVKQSARGEWATIRIGNREQIPGQYTSAKSFEPQIVARLKALVEHDMVDVRGYFSPWPSNPDKFDLIVQSIDRSAVPVGQ